MYEALSPVKFVIKKKKLQLVLQTLYGYLPLSNTKGAFGPNNIATAPAPPVGLAPPRAYVATSAATTIASLPN